MRIGICDWFKPDYPKFAWIEQAFQSLGLDTVRILTYGNLEREHESCDLVLFFQRPPIDWRDLVELSLARTCPWITWIFDYLCHELPLLSEVPWHAYDAVFAKTPDRLPVGVESVYLDQGIPPWEPMPPGEPRRFDCVMVGTWSTRREAVVAKAIQRRLRVAVVGRGWTERGGRAIIRGAPDCTYLGGQTASEAEMREVFQCATVALGDNFSNGCPGYWSDRMWLAIGAGTVYLGAHVSGMPRVLQDGQVNPMELLAKVRDPEWVAREWKFQQRLRRSHMYVDRVRTMLETLNDLARRRILARDFAVTLPEKPMLVRPAEVVADGPHAHLPVIIDWQPGDPMPDFGFEQDQ